MDGYIGRYFILRANVELKHWVNIQNLVHFHKLADCCARDRVSLVGQLPSIEQFTTLNKGVEEATY